MSCSLSRIVLLLGLFAFPVTASSAGAQESPTRPLPTDVQEATEARLIVKRIRIEPTRWADLGECRDLTIDDLSVSVRGKKAKRDSLDLDREWRPTLHALALDTSASMAGDLPYAQYAAAEYIRQLEPGRERGFLITFDENVRLLQGVTGDREELLEAVQNVQVGARTAMLDAMYYAMRELDAHEERPVLVLLTDGADIASFFGQEDLRQLTLARPDLTVFTIGVGLKTGEGEKPTKKLLRELADNTNGKFFDVAEGQSLTKVFGTIRDILENEAILTIVDPNPGRKRASVTVSSRKKNCTVRVFRSRAEAETRNDSTRVPIPKPYADPPQSYSTALTGGHQKLNQKAAEHVTDPACSSGGYFHRLFGGEPLEPLWFFHVGQRDISGCGLDVTMEYGLLFDPAVDGLATHNDQVKLRARPFELMLPPQAMLPGAPEEAMDGLARTALAVADSEVDTDPSKQPPELHARPFYDYPNVAHGMCFMEMRPVLARAAFLYPAYRKWALAKLSDAANADLAILQEGYRRRFPEYPSEILAATARASEDGQRILSRAESPAETDLQQYLAAWLGDITAHELFLRWERNTINEALAQGSAQTPDDRFVDGWSELRKIFFVPSYARVLTLLTPIYDSGCDCVGYWRVVLPRTSWMKPRIQELEAYRVFATTSLDLIPDIPFGRWAVSQLDTLLPGMVTHLQQQNYRVETLRYELLGASPTFRPGGAFRKTRVNLIFVGSEGDERSVEISVDVSLEQPTPTILGMGLHVVGDPTAEQIGADYLVDPDSSGGP